MTGELTALHGGGGDGHKTFHNKIKTELSLEK